MAEILARAPKDPVFIASLLFCVRNTGLGVPVLSCMPSLAACAAFIGASQPMGFPADVCYNPALGVKPAQPYSGRGVMHLN
jgi:hypothetical protein